MKPKSGVSEGLTSLTTLYLSTYSNGVILPRTDSPAWRHIPPGYECHVPQWGVLTHEQWKLLRRGINRFFAITTKAEIEGRNQEDLENTLAAVHHKVPKEPCRKKVGFTYLIASGGLHKIGITGDLDQRLATFRRSGMPRFTLEHHFASDDCRGSEIILHNRYADTRAHGEWFRLTEKEVDAIRTIAAFRDGQFLDAQGGVL